MNTPEFNLQSSLDGALFNIKICFIFWGNLFNYFCIKENIKDKILNYMKAIERVVIIGFRGAGKSTIASMLSEKLGWVYISTDDLIERKAGKTITKLVEEKGWKHFRILESEIIEKISKEESVVIDTGGGVIESEVNMNKLRQHSFIVWVDAELKDIIERVKNQNVRPLLNKSSLEEDISSNYIHRNPLYKKFCHLKVNTSTDSIDKICDQLLITFNKLSGRI
jgi:shikimate kinase